MNINPEHIKAVIGAINSSPYISLLSLNIQVIETGRCVIELDLDKKHLNPFSGIHGGVYASAIDTAAFWASYCSVPEEKGFTSIDLHIDNISTVQSGRLTVEGRTMKVGRTVCFSEASVIDEGGKLLAHGTSKQLISDGVKSIAQALSEAGAGLLPPKFL